MDVRLPGEVRVWRYEVTHPSRMRSNLPDAAPGKVTKRPALPRGRRCAPQPARRAADRPPRDMSDRTGPAPRDWMDPSPGARQAPTDPLRGENLLRPEGFRRWLLQRSINHRSRDINHSRIKS